MQNKCKERNREKGRKSSESERGNTEKENDGEKQGKGAINRLTEIQSRVKEGEPDFA